MAQKLTPQREQQAARVLAAREKLLADARRKAKADGAAGWNKPAK